MNLHFNRRKRWHFGEHKSISIEIYGWRSSPSIRFRAEPDERGVTFSIAFGFAIYISFGGFIPRSWYPTMSFTKGGDRYPEERELSISFHGGSLWWEFWVSEEWSSHFKNKTWRKGCWHIVDRIKGKHTCDRKLVDSRNFVLPFLEGNYSVRIDQYDRTDSWPRWFTSKMTTWEAHAGYYDGGKWIEKPIPVEGKGESSWDQDENATYSSSFSGSHVRPRIRTHYQALLYFWKSMMESRERYGSAQWIPKQFKERKLQVIR